MSRLATQFVGVFIRVRKPGSLALLVATLLCSGLMAGAACNRTDGSAARSSVPDAGEDSSGFTYEAMLAHLVDEIIVPSYGTFAEQSAVLNESAHGFCAELYPTSVSGDSPAEDGGPDAASTDAGAAALLATARTKLRTVRADYAKARDGWKACDAFAFGPYRDAPYRYGPKLDSYPVSAKDLGLFLTQEVATPALVAEQGTGKRGLPVVELLLFERRSVDADLESFLDDGGEKRCAYLTSLTEDAQTLAESMVAAWHDGYADAVKTAGRGSEVFPLAHDALSELVNRMVYAVENLREGKLRRPAGLGGDEPLPELFESHYSGRSARDAEAMLVGLQRLYLGEFTPGTTQDGFGMRDALLARGSDADRAVRAALDHAEKTLAGLDSFEAALESGPAALSTLHDQLKVLQLALGVDVAGALGVTVTFNDTDGD